MLYTIPLGVRDKNFILLYQKLGTSMPGGMFTAVKIVARNLFQCVYI